MAEVVQNADHEFWRAPMTASAQAPTGQTFVEACDRCSTEFVMGAAFCHVCGASRHPQAIITPPSTWTRYLQFHFIQERLGLPRFPWLRFSWELVSCSPPPSPDSSSLPRPSWTGKPSKYGASSGCWRQLRPSWLAFSSGANRTSS